MAYPVPVNTARAAGFAAELIQAEPFAHVFTAGIAGPRVSRLPLVLEGDPHAGGRLLGHLHRANPQAGDLEAGPVLAAFSGPDHYVPPAWRGSTARAPSWAYSAVHVRGRARIRPERSFFEAMINAVAAQQDSRRYDFEGEPWRMSDAPQTYIDRLFPHIVAFEIEIEDVEAIAKMEGDSPPDQRRALADHYTRQGSDDARALAEAIRTDIGTRP